VMGKEERGNGEQCSYEYMQKQVDTNVQIKSTLVCGHFIHMNLWTSCVENWSTNMWTLVSICMSINSPQINNHILKTNSLHDSG